MILLLFLHFFYYKITLYCIVFTIELTEHEEVNSIEELVADITSIANQSDSEDFGSEYLSEETEAML